MVVSVMAMRERMPRYAVMPVVIVQAQDGSTPP